MASYALVVTSSAKDGRDDEYNDWYDSTHLADICAIPGVVSGRRLEASPASPNATPSTYLAIYEIETDDPAAVMAELGRRAQAGLMPVSDALDLASAQLWLFKQR